MEFLKNSEKYELYSILGLEVYSSKEKVKNTGKILLKQIHPDKNQIGQDNEMMNEMFCLIKYSYQILSNTLTKIIYDEEGHRGLMIYFKFQEEFSKIIIEYPTKTIDSSENKYFDELQTRILKKLRKLKLYLIRINFQYYSDSVNSLETCINYTKSDKIGKNNNFLSSLNFYHTTSYISKDENSKCSLQIVNKNNILKKEFGVYPILCFTNRFHGIVYNFVYNCEKNSKYHKISYNYNQFFNPSIKGRFRMNNEMQICLSNKLQVDKNIIFRSKIKTKNNQFQKLNFDMINQLDDIYESKLRIKTSGKNKFSIIYQGKLDKDIKIFSEIKHCLKSSNSFLLSLQYKFSKNFKCRISNTFMYDLSRRNCFIGILGINLNFRNFSWTIPLQLSTHESPSSVFRILVIKSFFYLIGFLGFKIYNYIKDDS